MDDNRTNRYSLKIIDKKGNEIIIPINYNGKKYKQMPLTVIDMMTTNYTEDDFKKLLKSIGHDYDQIFIEYQYRFQRKRLDVVYNDQIAIKNESSYRQNLIINGEPEPTRSENITFLCHELINIQRNEPQLWSYLQNKKYIWEKLTSAVNIHNHLIDTKADDNDVLYWQTQIMKYIGNYSTFRKITLAIDQYHKEQKKENEKFSLHKEARQNVAREARQNVAFNPNYASSVRSLLRGDNSYAKICAARNANNNSKTPAKERILSKENLTIDRKEESDMSKSEKGLYSLVHVALDGKKSKVRMRDGSGKLTDHFPLTTIDAFTTSFENMEELLNLVREVNIPKKDCNDDMLDGYFEIEYQNSGRTKLLRVLFADTMVINSLSRIYNGKYRMEKNDTITVWIPILVNTYKEKPELYRFLVKKGYIDSYLDKLIEKYMYYSGQTEEQYSNPYEASDYRASIIDKLESYKTFRGLIVGLEEYDYIQNHYEISNKTPESQEEIDQIVNELVKLERPVEKVKRRPSQLGQQRLPGFEYMDLESGYQKRKKRS